MTRTSAHPSIARVLAASLDRAYDDHWDRGAHRVDQQRQQINHLLAAEPTPRIYGFTTLLGHLDGSAASARDQWTLLDAHCIGTPRTLSPDFGRLLAACKLEQASLGGTGMSPNSFAALRDRATQRDAHITGDWTASYGAGDVVPGAWLARDVFSWQPQNHFATGDVIAMINGNHISTAIALVAAAQATHELLDSGWAAAFLARGPAQVSADTAAPIAGTGVPAASELVAMAQQCDDAQERSTDRDTQAPLSLRDAVPLLSSGLTTLRRTVESIADRLESPSANPLFTGEPIEALSQSSFLDFTLTHALTGLQQSLHLTAGLWQRFIVHESESQGDRDPARALVQPAKVAQAIVERMAGLAILPSRFTGADSAGIEDVRDLSLQSALRVLELATLCGEIRRLANTIPSLDVLPLPTPEFIRHYTRVAWGDAVDARITAAFAQDAASLLGHEIS